MKKRVFIALDLPPEIKSELNQARESINNSFEECPIRWVTDENWHITLVFLGMLDETGISQAKECLAEVVSLHKPFKVSVNKISWAPKNEMPPKYVWAQIMSEENLLNLQKDLIEKLIDKGIRLEVNQFVAHITLGRVIQWAFRQIDPLERPDITQEIDLEFMVESVDLLESKLGRQQAEYKLIESYPI